MPLGFARATSSGAPSMVKGRVRLFLLVKPESLVCPGRQSREVSRKGRRFRELPTVPMGLRPVFLVTEAPKGECRQGGQRFEIAPLCPGVCHLHASAGNVRRGLARRHDDHRPGEGHEGWAGTRSRTSSTGGCRGIMAPGGSRTSSLCRLMTLIGGGADRITRWGWIWTADASWGGQRSRGRCPAQVLAGTAVPPGQDPSGGPGPEMFSGLQMTFS